jgi:hypothetical protein
MYAASKGRTHGRTDQHCKKVHTSLAKGAPFSNRGSFVKWVCDRRIVA